MKKTYPKPIFAPPSPELEFLNRDLAAEMRTPTPRAARLEYNEDWAREEDDIFAGFHNYGWGNS